MASLEARIRRLKGLSPAKLRAFSQNGGTRGDIGGKLSGISSPLCEGEKTRSKVLKLKSTRTESAKEKGSKEQRFYVTPPCSHSEMESLVDDGTLGKPGADNIAILGVPLPLPVEVSVETVAEAEASLPPPQTQVSFDSAPPVAFSSGYVRNIDIGIGEGEMGLQGYSRQR
ncbi:hypothetical protein U1Q18_040608 [Sarracenia purpurea var. burkii]